MRFIKMHGLGNDFVILDLRDGKSEAAPQKIAEIANRKTGIGCDQVIFLLPPSNPGAELFMQIYNMDGSEAEACGNATRCVAMLIMNETKKDMVVIETVAGLLPCWKEPDGRISANMGEPKFGWKDIPLSEERDTLHMGIGEGDVKDPVGVNVGNPHAVFFVKNVESLDVQEIGPAFETHELFPRKINVEFVEVKNRKELRMRVWERNAGETHACGSGACATLVAAVRRGLAERKADVILDGGTLTIDWREKDNQVIMTGPATYVFDGALKNFS